MLLFTIPGLAQLILHGRAVLVIAVPVLCQPVCGILAIGVMVEVRQMGDGVAVHDSVTVSVHFRFQSAIFIVSTILMEPS